MMKKWTTAWMLFLSTALFCLVLLPEAAYGAVSHVTGDGEQALTLMNSEFQNGNEVALDRDVTLPADQSLRVDESVNAVLDLAGHTLTLNGAVLTVEGKLTFKDSLGTGSVVVKNSGRLSAVPGGLNLGTTKVRNEGGTILYRVATSADATPVEVPQDLVITNLNMASAQTVEKGSVLDLGVQFKPVTSYYGVSMKAQWSSGDLSTAAVDAASGKVTGLKPGTSAITAVLTDFPTITSLVNVTVTDSAVTGITLSEHQSNLKVGAQIQLNAVVQAGSDASAEQKKVTWSSDNTAVATVDAEGRVSGVSQGLAQITASVGSGAGVKTDTCKMIVYDSVVGTVEMTPILNTSVDTAAGKITVKMPYDIYSEFSEQTKILVNVLLPASTINNVIAQSPAKEIRVEIYISKEVEEKRNVSIVNVKAGEEIFKKLKELNKNLAFEIRRENGGALISSWSFTGSQITRISEMNLHTELIKTSDIAAIKRLAGSTSKNIVLRVAQDGNFAGRAKVTASLDSSIFSKGNAAYLYFYNESRNRLEYMGSLTKVDENLCTSMTLSKGGDYLITKSRMGTSHDDDDDDETVIDTGKWMQNNVGWWYRNSNGSYPANKWQKINSKWYLFDQNGYMLTGWQFRNSIWYYLQPSGDMVENNWVQSKGRWYFLQEGGGMATGWVKWKSQWYFMSVPNGEMVERDWLNINNQWFYVGDNGVMFANQWLYYKDKWFFFQSDGVMAYGWVKWKNNWYYMNNPYGDMAVNTTLPGGYRVNGDGVMY